MMMAASSRAALSAAADDVSFMLEHFVRNTAGVEQVIGVSSDGLLMALAADMGRAEADKMAATVSGMTTLAVSASLLLTKGALTQVITEFEGGYLVASLIKGRACLGVVTNRDCDLGLVGYETTLLVGRVGDILTPELVTEMKNRLAL
ncbi:MAG: dynein regulation protein LC7 [Micrococcales bacterium]|nr:MAG: dynein regulation protein LC7 [Micrococcales bacterium]